MTSVRVQWDSLGYMLGSNNNLNGVLLQIQYMITILSLDVQTFAALFAAIKHEFSKLLK